jgi:CRP-like cAMP-binding protein
MYFKQRDIFGSLDKGFVGKIMDIAESASLAPGELLFQEGDCADWFYILVKGRIKLSFGQTGRIVYVVSHGGEAFGWSSLVGRQRYSASAECLTATKLLKFDKKKLETLTQKDTDNGMILFKSLAALLGDRLIRGYVSSLSAAEANDFSSYGTGQVMDVVETELEK